LNGSDNPDYLTARIARDRPDILAEMQAGTYPSVRAAALAAGIVKARVSVPLDTARAAAVLLRHFDKQELIDALLRAYPTSPGCSSPSLHYSGGQGRGDLPP